MLGMGVDGMCMREVIVESIEKMGRWNYIGVGSSIYSCNNNQVNIEASSSKGERKHPSSDRYMGISLFPTAGSTW